MMKEAIDVVDLIETKQQVEKPDDILINKIENYKKNTNQIKMTFDDFNEIFESLSKELLEEIGIKSTNDLIDFVGYNFKKETENNKNISNNKLKNNIGNVIPIKDRLNKYEIENELNGYKISKQDPKTSVCGYYNLFSALEWIHKENGTTSPDLSNTISITNNKALYPKSFIKLFNKYSPDGYTVELMHPENEEIIDIIKNQISNGLPIPIIYVPIGGKIHTPHYASITGIGYDKNGKNIFKLTDSLDNIIPRNYLTENELIQTIKFNNLRSDNLILDIGYKGFRKLSQMVLGGENNIFVIKGPDNVSIELSLVA